MADQPDEPAPPAESSAAVTVADAEPADRRMRQAVGVALVALVAMTCWLGWRDLQVRGVERRHAAMVQAGRDGMVALTTVDHNQVDRDVQRILDASTGSFRDDFAARADSFKAAAREAQSTSVGTVTEAGFESVEGDAGRVLVALTVMTSNRGAPERQPKAWRTRVTVTRDGEAYRLAAVEFVP